MQNPKKVFEFIAYLVLLIGLIIYLIVIKVNKPIGTVPPGTQTNEKVQSAERVQ